MAISAHAQVPAANRLDEADTTNLTAISRPADIRFPVNPSYAGRAAVPGDDDRARRAWEAIQTRDSATVDQAAVQLGIPVVQVYELALDFIAAQTGWTAGERGAVAALPSNPVPCPSWCTADHSQDTDERLHSSDGVKVTAPSGVDLLDTVTVLVQLDAFAAPELPGGIDPTSIYLSVVCDKANETQAAGNLSPEQAEQLGQALLAAARTAREARA